MRIEMDIQTLIDRGGGTKAFAVLLGVGRTTVLDWKRSGTIPGSRLLQISTALGIPAADLVGLVAPRVPPPTTETLAFA